MSVLANFALTQPHAVSVLVHVAMSGWSLVSQTVPDIQSLLQPFEDRIYSLLSAALTGCPPCYIIERDIFALPSRLGGLGTVNPSDNSPSSGSFQALVTLTTPLMNQIISQKQVVPVPLNQ